MEVMKQGHLDLLDNENVEIILVAKSKCINLGPVFQKPINANPRLKINQGVYFSTPKCCSKLIFSRT